MQIKITHENIEPTDAIREYVEDKISLLTNFQDDLQIADVVVGKTTNHHNKGEVFHCRVNVSYPGGLYRADEMHEDLYTAIGASEAVLQREIIKHKEKLHSHRDHTDIAETLV